MMRLSPVILISWFFGSMFSSCAVSQVTEQIIVPDTIPYFRNSKYEESAEILYPRKTYFIRPKFTEGLDALQRYLEDGHKVKSDSAKFLRYKRSDPLIICDIDENGQITNVRLSDSPALWYRNYPPIESSILKAVEVVRSMPKWKPGTLHGKPVYVTDVPLRVAVLVK